MSEEKDTREESGKTVQPQEEKDGSAESSPEKEKEKPESAEAEKSAEPESGAESTEDTGKRKKAKNKMSSFFHSSKFRHGSTATAFTAVFIAAVVLLNVIVGMLGDRFPSMNIDMTKSGANTLTEEAEKIVDKVKVPTTITICATKQQVDNNTVLQSSSGEDYSQVGRIAEKIAERNHNIQVEYKDLDKNPDFAAKYKSDGVQAGSVVVATDKRYRVLSPSTDLFKTEYSQDYSSSTTYSNVDSAYASALNTVIAETLPVAAFDTGHSEQLDTSGIKKILQDNAFEAKDFNLLTDKIPDKTQLIVLGCPTTDYTADEITKLESFLKDTKLAADRSLMITFSPGEAELPKFNAFLEEWGLKPQTDAVVVETDNQKYVSNPSYLLGDIQTKLDLGGSGSYNYFFTPSTCPVDITFSSSNDRSTYQLVTSSDASYIYHDGDSTKNPQTSAQNLAALSQGSVKTGGKTYKANVIAFGSTLMFAPQIIEQTTYGNGAYMVDLSKYATGTANTSTSVTTKTTELNPQDMTLNAQQIQILGLWIFTILIPLAVAVAGAVVHHKRRLL